MTYLVNVPAIEVVGEEILLIDVDRIQALREEVGPDDLEEVIGLFCEEVEEVLAALDGTPPKDFPARLHFLKGSALNLGLDQVGALCREEELRLKSDPEWRPDVGAIRRAYSEARQILVTL